MKTPIADFVRHYAESGMARFHMPAHKGRGSLGCEPLDVTEICGADVLFDASGIIAQSEANATSLFGSAHTFYSTEGSSLCIKAMLAAATEGRAGARVLAARNAHKSFIYACALLDLDVEWLYPNESGSHVCSCPISPDEVARALDDSVAAVYITSPDYLGGIADVSGIARVCHQRGVPLLVDNAHGAYLRFLSPSAHPLDLGADMCCDSAHKTLPVLTGGAYLHVADERYSERVKRALPLFASTSPSYLTLQSLDLCNAYIANGYAERLADFIREVDGLKARLSDGGIPTEQSDPLKLVIRASALGITGAELADILRDRLIEPELADVSHVVLMLSPDNTPLELSRLESALFGIKKRAPLSLELPHIPRKNKKMASIRHAVLSRSERVPAELSVGRICAAPVVSCPPAIPIAVSGELITQEHVNALLFYGNTTVAVLAED